MSGAGGSALAIMRRSAGRIGELAGSAVSGVAGLAGDARALLVPPPALRRVPVTARAIAATYSPDDRQAFLLIALPLFLMAFAIAASQSGRRLAPYEEVASHPLPVAVTPPAPVIAVPARSESAPVAAGRIERAEPAATVAGDVVTPPSPVVPDVADTSAERLAVAAPASDERLAVGSSLASPAQPVVDDNLPEAAELVSPAEPAASSPTFASVPGAEAQPGPAGAFAVAPGPALRPDMATSPADGQAAVEAAPADERVEVAALAPGPAETPQAPVTAVAPPAEIKTETPVCVADASSDMKRRPVLGARVVTSDPEAFGLALAAAAREQVDDFIVYTDKYYNISYPMGDIPALYGVCTDVIIRAYRAVGVDLQKLIHEARAGSGDTNIEHRRVDTQRKFFEKMGASLPITEFAEDYRPGDVVSYYRPQNRHSRTHIAIVSDVIGPSGRPMIIHNRGWGPQLEDALFVDQITGHYRYAGPKTDPGSGAVLAGEPIIPGSQFSAGGKKVPVLRTNVAAPRAQSRARTQVR